MAVGWMMVAPLPAAAQFQFLEGLSGSEPIDVPASGTPNGAIVGTNEAGRNQ
jgi:hypothetical protein